MCYLFGWCGGFDGIDDFVGVGVDDVDDVCVVGGYEEVGLCFVEEYFVGIFLYFDVFYYFWCCGEVDDDDFMVVEV